MKTRSILTLIFFLTILAVGFSQNEKVLKGKYLMVIDVQEEYINNKPYADSARKMISNLNTLISHFPPGQVIYIQNAGMKINVSWEGFSRSTEPASRFDSTLKVVNNNIFTKLNADAFNNAELVHFLESRNAKEIILTGLLAEKCVYQTALGGMKKGYKMYLIPEAVTGQSSGSKEKSLKKLWSKGIISIPLKDISNQQ